MALFPGMTEGVRGAAMGPVLQSRNNVGNAIGSATSSFRGSLNGTVATVSSGVMNGVGNAAWNALNGGSFLGGLGAIPGNINRDLNRMWQPSTPYSGGSANPGNALAGMAARQDAVLGFNWFCLMPEIPGAKLPWYYVEAASLPFRAFETQTIYRRSHDEKYPAGYSVADLTCTFYLDNSLASLQYIRAWQGLVLSNGDPRDPRNQGRWGRARSNSGNGFYRNIEFHVLSVNKQELLTMMYFDAWPTQVDTLQLVSDNGERLVLEVTFSVNDVDFLSSPMSASSMFGLKALGQNLPGFSMASLGSVGNIIPQAVSSFFKPAPKYDPVADSYY